MSDKIITFNGIFSEMKNIANYSNFLESTLSNTNIVRVDYDLYTINGIKFPNLTTKDMEHAQTLSHIPYYRNLQTNRKVLGPVIIFIKRVIRKISKFLIEPIITDMLRVNTNNIELLCRLANTNNMLISRIAHFESDIESLKKHVDCKMDELKECTMSSIVSQQELRAMYEKYIDRMEYLELGRIQSLIAKFNIDVELENKRMFEMYKKIETTLKTGKPLLQIEDLESKMIETAKEIKKQVENTQLLTDENIFLKKQIEYQKNNR